MRCVLRPRVVGIGGKHLCYDCDENDADDDRDVELSARNCIGRRCSVRFLFGIRCSKTTSRIPFSKWLFIIHPEQDRGLEDRTKFPLDYYMHVL